jgi:Holliday junction resolvase RusA-like endonuclease
VRVVIPWKPHAKQRPRSGRGHTYTPPATKKAEQAIRDAFLAAQPEGFEPYALEIDVTLQLANDSVIIDIQPTGPWINRKLRGDGDNYAKTLLDALNGIAWEDDKWIRTLKVRKV